MGKKQNPPVVRMTSKEVCSLLGVTPMMLTLYRKGEVASKTKLPFRTKPRGTQRHSVYFVRSQVLNWARNNAVTLVEEV